MNLFWKCSGGSERSDRDLVSRTVKRGGDYEADNRHSVGEIDRFPDLRSAGWFMVPNGLENRLVGDVRNEPALVVLVGDIAHTIRYGSWTENIAVYYTAYW